MSGTVNKVILIGHTGDDVKLHTFDNGNSIGRVSLATKESWNDKQTNEKKSVTDWHNLILRNKKAEVFEKYVKKGHKVYIEGKLKTRKWQNGEKQDQWTTEIEVFNFTFLQNKLESNNYNQGSAVNDYENEKRPENAGNDFLNMPKKEEEVNDDLPF